MFHQRLTRLALSGLLITGAAVAVMATPASATPASAAPAGSAGIDAGCRFVLSKVIANELQESGQDEIYLRIGDEYTDTVRFAEGETHLAAEFGSAAQTTEFIATGDRIGVWVYEADFPSGDDLLGSFSVSCTPNHYTRTVTGFGSNYDVVFDVVTA